MLSEKILVTGIAFAKGHVRQRVSSGSCGGDAIELEKTALANCWPLDLGRVW